MLQEELWISKWKLICKQQGEATIDQKARKEGGMEDREKDSPVGQKQGDETTSRILWLNWSLGMRTVFSKPNPCLLNCKSLEGNYWTRVFRTALTANPRERVSIYRIIGWKKNEKNLHARSGHQIEVGRDLQVNLTSLAGYAKSVRISKIISNSISLCIHSKRIKHSNRILPNQYFLFLYLIVALEFSFR